MNFVISDNENHIVMDGGTFKNSLGSNRFTLAPIFNAMRISSGNINHNLFIVYNFRVQIKYFCKEGIRCAMRVTSASESSCS